MYSLFFSRIFSVPAFFLTLTVGLHALVLPETVLAQNESTLPQCKGNESSKWNACVGSANVDYGEYTGSFKNGRFEGQGTLNFSNGEIYIGQFRDGNSEGLGLHIKPNGERYAGAFKDNNYHGKGIFVGADGKVRSEGIWENDKLARPEKVTDAAVRALLTADKKDTGKHAKLLPARGSVDTSKLAPLTFYVEKNADWLETIKDVDGQSILAHPERLSGKHLRVCLLVNEKDYQSQGVTYFRESVKAIIVDYFAKLAKGLTPVSVDIVSSQGYDPKLEHQIEFSYQTDCWNWSRSVLDLQNIQLVVARSKDEANLVKKIPIFGGMINPNQIPSFLIVANNSYDAAFVDVFEALVQVNVESIAATHAAVAEVKDQKAAAQNALMAEFAQLAAQGSHDSVVSLTLQYIKKPDYDAGLQLCSTVHYEERQLAIDGYRLLGMGPYSEGLRENIKISTYKSRIYESINVYEDINQLYAEYQKGTTKCHVFVDYPANVNKLRNAILRDHPKALVELNELYPLEVLLDKVTVTRTDYKSYAELKFATAIGASSKDLKKLQDNNAGDPAAFARLVDEMKSVGYPLGSSSLGNADYALAFLRDREEGGSPQGAVKVMEARHAAKARAVKDAAERRRKLNAMRAKKSFRMGIICVGMQAISSSEIGMVLNLYASNAHVMGITRFISSSQTCMLRDAVLRGEQLTEINRQGRFVTLRSSASNESNALYGILPLETWDNP